METSINLANILKGRDRQLDSPTPSKRAEVYYRDALGEFIKTMVNEIISSMRKAKLTDAVAIGDDDYINELINTLSVLAGKSIEEQARRLSTSFTAKVHFQNKDQFKRYFNNAFGVDMSKIIDNESLSDTFKRSVENNIKLITSIKTDFINDIGANVFENFKKGGRHSDLIKSIYERGNVTYSRAKMIARDQSAKLNADFNEERSVKLGFDEYKWKGAGDIRERDSHSALNNMLCKYSDPTVYSDDDGKTWKERSSIGAFIGKPGEDYQCRCLPIARIRF